MTDGTSLPENAATAREFSSVDFERSAENLSVWLRERRQSEWSPTETVNGLRELAKRLDDLASDLWKPEWMDLQDAVDEDPPPAIGLDGWPIPRPPEESRLGRYEACQDRMREIASFARELADKYPAAQARPYLQEAATAFLHLWREDGRERPKMYDNGEVVTAFERVLQKGGHHYGSPSSVRTILTKAWNTFDHHMRCPLFDQIVVWHQ